MLQGTGSDVGKSLLLAGMARAFTRQGLNVRPFKSQNMSNNAAVTADGGEIGRAQALQARACCTAPITDMNPVLLKPQSEIGAQIVLHGRVWRAAGAGEYRRLAPSLLPAILDSFSRLAKAADLVLVEGAGSPAEINLRDGDIANMGFAEAADVPVVVVGDIERGGVIAQLVGTHALLSASERALLAGYIVNKFRGDVRLFDGGIAAIGERTGLRCFGVVPYFPDAALLPAEDSMALIHPHPPISGVAGEHAGQVGQGPRARAPRGTPAPGLLAVAVDVGGVHVLAGRRRGLREVTQLDQRIERRLDAVETDAHAHREDALAVDVQLVGGARVVGGQARLVHEHLDGLFAIGRVIQPALAGLRGTAEASSRTYRADGVSITLELGPSAERGQAALLGLVVSEADDDVRGEARLTGADGTDQSTAIDELGSFSFASLASGTYQLALQLGSLTLVVEDVTIGAEPHA